MWFFLKLLLLSNFLKKKSHLKYTNKTCIQLWKCISSAKRRQNKVKLSPQVLSLEIQVYGDQSKCSDESGHISNRVCKLMVLSAAIEDTYRKYNHLSAYLFLPIYPSIYHRLVHRLIHWSVNLYLLQFVNPAPLTQVTHKVMCSCPTV